MVFKIDDGSGKSIATILKDGNTETYDCSFSSCTNPVCTCKSIEIVLTPLQDGNQNGQVLSSRRVAIDLIEKVLYASGKYKTPPEDLVFAGLFLSQLTDNDFNFLSTKQFDFKNQITEKADIDSIEGFFDYEAVERDGLMYEYNSVLPYGNQMLVNINGEDVDCRDLIPRRCHDVLPVYGRGRPRQFLRYRGLSRQQSTALSYPLASGSPLVCLCFTQISLSGHN
ncbi:MAG: hypothetical protein HN597_18880 [Desulfobacula sp.]|uniref:hypothetical protein n=1 Tax=Desulfobacula sp. TaxID=2593537 RepID=UPI0039B91C8C|nr:hypothetical protein [Desulfobacula sp.]